MIVYNSIRTYREEDLNSVIELLRANTPTYFASEEEVDFKNYLKNEREDYFVVTDNFEVIAAGGINYFYPMREARISWDMVHPDFHGKGVGKQLLMHRLNHLSKKKEIDSVIVRTSQHAYIFYEKTGFSLKEVKKDYWAKGFDLYLMKLHNPF